MAAPDEQPTNEMASETESIANEEESNTNNAATENHASVNEEASNSSCELVLGTHSATNQLPSENPSTANIIDSSSQVGLLSLPPEVRVIVFQHLLLRRGSLNWSAFQVYFGENTFYVGSMLPKLSILNVQPIRDTLQNIHFVVRLNDPSPHRTKSSFIRMIHELGSPTSARGTLLIHFVVITVRDDLLPWYARSLPRFTNFRTIQFEFLGTSADILAKRLCSLLCHNHELEFHPFFGPAEYVANGRGLRFHPRRYLNSLPPEVEVDWMEYLDGVRLNWNEDPSPPPTTIGE